MDDQKILNKIKEFILKNDNFIITSHVNSDGDSIGCELTIAELLSQLNKNYYILNNDAYSDYLAFLPKINIINTDIKHNTKDFKNLIIVDTTFSIRIGERIFNFLNYLDTENIVIIDHHPNSLINDKSYISNTASSTGELVYNLLEYMNINITTNIALYLFVAIFTDTFGFRQSNTTQRSMFITSQLFDKLAGSYYKIIEHLYDDLRYPALKLLGELLNTVKRYKGDEIIYGYLTREMFDKHNAKDSDLENFINYLRSVHGVKVACIIRETEKDDIKINLRAKDENVNLVPFVKKFKNGGGHPQAAGFTLPMADIENIKERVLNELYEYLNQQPS